MGIETAILGSAALSAGAGIFGSVTGAKAQKDAQAAALASQQRMFGQVMDTVQPLVGRGQNIIDTAFPTLRQLLTPGPGMTEALTQIPGFQFAQDWGKRQVSALGAMRGLGGNVLKAGADYATGKAMDSYGGIVNALQALLNSGSGLATGAAGTLAGASGVFSGQMSNAYTNMGNASAAGALGASNAIGNFAGQAGNLAMLKYLMGGGGGSGGGSGMYGAGPSWANADMAWGT